MRLINKSYEFRWQKGISRYYRILIYRDLLNDWILTCIWGGVQTRLGNFKHTTLQNLQEGFAFVEDMKIRRKQRGYSLIN